jgi:hypothetical protein
VWANGYWDCDASTFVNLWNGSSYYATQSWAAKRGSFTSGDTHSHTVLIDGVEYETSSEAHYHVQN